MPTLRQLKALTLIADHGSFTRAAEHLFVTQSAVSALIRELEEEIGIPLISRGRVISLTAAGDVLRSAARRADMEIDRAVHEARNGGKTAQTVLRVAAGSLSAAALLPPAIAALRKLAPTIRIVLVDRPVGMLGDMLMSGEADIAVGSVNGPLGMAGKIRSSLITEDRIAVVCARRSELARQAEKAGGLNWRDLRGAELILVGRAGGQWSLLLQDRVGIDGIEIGYEVQLFSTAIEMVRCDLGAAFLPVFATEQLDPAQFCVTPLLQTSARWSTYFLTRIKSTDASKAEATLLLRKLLGSRIGNRR